MYATITSKGQITVPKVLRDKLNLHPGDRIEFIEDEKGGYLVQPVTASITALKGMVSVPDKPVTLEEMQQAIAAGLKS
jgi:antitoxin PrlF